MIRSTTSPTTERERRWCPDLRFKQKTRAIETVRKQRTKQQKDVSSKDAPQASRATRNHITHIVRHCERLAVRSRQVQFASTLVPRLVLDAALQQDDLDVNGSKPKVLRGNWTQLVAHFIPLPRHQVPIDAETTQSENTWIRQYRMTEVSKALQPGNINDS